MAYKAKFRPSEILRAGQWVPLETAHTGAAFLRESV